LAEIPRKQETTIASLIACSLKGNYSSPAIIKLEAKDKTQRKG